jgi:hypothetical protein
MGAFENEIHKNETFDSLLELYRDARLEIKRLKSAQQQMAVTEERIDRAQAEQYMADTQREALDISKESRDALEKGKRLAFPTELNGRPAKTYLVRVSERQFQIAEATASGIEVMAESSSTSTLQKCLQQMFPGAEMPGVLQS